MFTQLRLRSPVPSLVLCLLSPPRLRRQRKSLGCRTQPLPHEEETNHEEEFMTEEEAVKMILPKSQRVHKEMIRLTQEKKELIEQRIGWKFRKSRSSCISVKPETRSTAMP